MRTTTQSCGTVAEATAESRSGELATSHDPAALADAILTVEELGRLARIAVERLGVERIRLTGGEPLMRRDLEEIVAAVASLRTRTLDDYAVEPLYTAATAPGLPAAAPGEFPFTRGGALRPADLPWDVRQAFDDPDAARTAEQVAEDLEHGVSSVHLVIGSAGLDAGDLATALEPVLTDLAPISLSCPTSRVESLAGARALADLLADQPVLTQAPAAAQQVLAFLRGWTPA